MKKTLPWWSALLLIPLVALPAPPKHTTEMIGACEHAEVPEAVRKTLQPQGIRVKEGDSVLCDIWLRAVIPQMQGSKSADYGTMANGTLAGVIHYHEKGGDYRGQAVRTGVYTLRYQVIPQDGNHLGVSPGPHFFLLAPAKADTDPDALIDPVQLVDLSKQASGTNHPNPLLLAYPAHDGAVGFHDTGEHGAVEAKTKAKPAGGAEIDFPLSIVLIGRAEG